MKRIRRTIWLIAAAVSCLAPAASAEAGPELLGLTAAASSVTLVWRDTGAAGYAVYRGVSPYGSFLPIGTSAENTYTDHAVKEGGVYYYKIRAIGRDGAAQGAYSAPKGICCLQIVPAPAEQNPCYRQDRRIEVKGLMLHSIGCPQEQAAVIAQSMNRPDAGALVHAVVDPSGSVWQLADWELRCWHCGGAGNDTLIGIEMGEPSELRYLDGSCFAWSGDAARTAASCYDAAVSLFAALCLRYELDPLRDVVSHFEAGQRGDASGHADPEHLWIGLGLPFTMDGFRRDVQKKLMGVYRGRSAELTGRIVTVTAQQLNIRSGPGLEYAVAGALYRDERIAVGAVTEGDGHRWGQLQNGRWIALTYTAD